MDSTTGSSASSRAIKGYALLGVAFLTCPCHLPILLALLAGTSLGALIASHFALAALVLVLTFVGSLILAQRVLRKEEDCCEVPTSGGGTQ